MPRITTITRDKNGEYPSHDWPGCYPIYYLNKREDILCPTCANKSVDLDSFDFAPTHWETHYEGAPLACGCCGKVIESAYGDPEEEEEEEEEERKELQEHCSFCTQELTPLSISLAVENSGLTRADLTFFCPSYEVLASDSGPFERCHVYWEADRTMPATYTIKD